MKDYRRFVLFTAFALPLLCGACTGPNPDYQCFGASDQAERIAPPVDMATSTLDMSSASTDMVVGAADMVAGAADMTAPGAVCPKVGDTTLSVTFPVNVKECSGLISLPLDGQEVANRRPAWRFYDPQNPPKFAYLSYPESTSTLIQVENSRGEISEVVINTNVWISFPLGTKRIQSTLAYEGALATFTKIAIDPKAGKVEIRLDCGARPDRDVVICSL